MTLQRPSKIEWFDPEINKFYGSVVDTLKSEGHSVHVYDEVNRRDIDRLREQRVDLIVTELFVPSNDLGAYSTEGFSTFSRNTNSYGGVKMGGLQLLEALNWSYNANTSTPKLIFTSYIENEITNRSKIHVNSGRYLLKPMDHIELTERFRLLLPLK